MAAGYSKEFLVDAALYRFEYFLGKDKAESLRQMYEAFYDEKGKEVFRKYASVTPSLIRAYKNKIEPEV